jgi:hypothetical protein
VEDDSKIFGDIDVPTGLDNETYSPVKVEEKEVKIVKVYPTACTLNEMETILKDKFDDNPLTLKQNMSYLKCMLKILNKDVIDINHYFSPRYVISLFNKQKLQQSTVKNYLHMIMKIFKCFDMEPDEEYYTEIGKIKKEISEQKSFQASDKESIQLKWLEENEDRLRERLTNSTLPEGAEPQTFGRLALFVLHVDFPCVRRDFKSVQVVREDVDDGVTNFYNMNTSKLCLNSFKNKSPHVPQMIAFLNKYHEVHNTVNNWLDVHPMREESTFPMFLSKSGKPIKLSTFNLLMNSIFDDRKISTNILRKYYIKKNVFSGTKTPSEIKEINRIMCHTISTALSEYAKEY